MSYNKWPKRSAEKNYFMVPNEIFSIGLDFREISLYSYLLRCENRKTYQCYPSYKTIGHAIGMSENTVAKYVRQLEEKGLIYTEPTIMQSKDGKPLNGNLLYTIRPIQAAIELSQKLKIEKVTGTIIIVKVMNRPAFEHRNGSMGLTDGRNLNREFPGNPDGTEMESSGFGAYVSQ